MAHCLVLLLIACLSFCSALAAAQERPNLLLITVDDMSADVTGAYGSAVPAITPNIDRLAAAGLRFELAHVQVANCKPSRNVMWSGRYPHSNKVEGFAQVGVPGYPNIVDLAAAAGYFTAIRHKVADSTPYHPYPWDIVLDTLPGAAPPDKKDPVSYGRSATLAIEMAQALHKPFLIMLNVADPHIPFFGLDLAGNAVADAFVPSRIYRADEVVVPGFLVDDPVVRQELTHYYASVRRADDAVGRILQALKNSGEADNTIVMLVSDHGMPFPFAKTQLYHQSTHVPLVLRWPGVIQAGAVDDQHMVSAVDILPTLLEAADIALPEGLQGRSFLPLLEGAVQSKRDRIFKAYSENSAAQRRPMRAVQTHRYLYIFNPWSDGVRTLHSATNRTKTQQRMEALAAENDNLAARLAMLKHRAVEEFYNVQEDPDSLLNLIDDPAYQKQISRLRAMLLSWMRETDDPLLPIFLAREDASVRTAFMQAQDLQTKNRKIWTQAIRARRQQAPLEATP